MNSILGLGTIALLSFAGTSIFLQEYQGGNKQEIMQLRIENRQLKEASNVCQTSLNRLESEFQVYRDAIKDSRP